MDWTEELHEAVSAVARETLPHRRGFAGSHEHMDVIHRARAFAILPPGSRLNGPQVALLLELADKLDRADGGRASHANLLRVLQGSRLDYIVTKDA